VQAVAAAKTKTARKKPARKSAAPGRKSKISETMILIISENIAKGAPAKYAVKGLVDETTYYRWLRKGKEIYEKDKESKDLYCKLYQSVEKAELECMLSNLAVIENAASEGKWQAAAWTLERRFPDVFSIKSPMNVNAHLTGKTDEDPIKTESTVQIYIPDNGRNRKPDKKKE
jgi:hypothetical protein